MTTWCMYIFHISLIQVLEPADPCQQILTGRSKPQIELNSCSSHEKGKVKEQKSTL